MMVTSQLYFDDAVNDEVHTMPPYSQHGPVSRTNGQDGIFTATTNNQTLVASTADNGGGYVSELVIGVS
jgi:hypothetical protein